MRNGAPVFSEVGGLILRCFGETPARNTRLQDLPFSAAPSRGPVALTQPSHKICWRNHFDPERFAQNEQIAVPRDQEFRTRGQCASKKRFVLCIAAALFSQRRRLSPTGFEPKPGGCAGTVAGRETGLKFGRNGFVFIEDRLRHGNPILTPSQSCQATSRCAAGPENCADDGVCVENDLDHAACRVFLLSRWRLMAALMALLSSVVGSP